MFKFVLLIIVASTISFAADTTVVSDTIKETQSETAKIIEPVKAVEDTTTLKKSAAVTQASVKENSSVSNKVTSKDTTTNGTESSASVNKADLSVAVGSSDSVLYTLNLNSTPGSASVIFDDSAVGKTPIILKDITAGIHKLILNKKGYFPKKVTVNIKKSDSLTLNLLAPVKLSVKTNPDGSTFFIKDKKIALTPVGGLNLRPGSYDISLRKEGFVTKDTSLVLEEGKISDSLFAKLVPIVTEKKTALEKSTVEIAQKKEDLTTSEQDRKKKILNRIALSVFMGFSLVILIIELSHKN